MALNIETLKSEYFKAETLAGFGSWFTSTYEKTFSIHPRQKEYINDSSNMRQAIKRIKELGYVQE